MTVAVDATPQGFEADGVRYELTLFVSGASELSIRAIVAARELCDVHLAGRAQLTVVDVHEAPTTSLGQRVFATPTLVKTSPLPIRKLVGSLSQGEKVLLTLEIPVYQHKKS
jgi:circadian clock protein KaiB